MKISDFLEQRIMSQLKTLNGPRKPIKIIHGRKKTLIQRMIELSKEEDLED